MPFKLIKGEFRIIGAAPDGDSIRFYPTAERAFERAGVNARVNRAGGAQLRLDGIDTLETHYAPQVGGTGVLHQPLAIGHAAADHLLKQFGFTKVERNTDETVTHAEPESTPGYIFTRFADQYGRCVAFAFPGECDQDDLDTVFVDANCSRPTVTTTSCPPIWATPPTTASCSLTCAKPSPMPSPPPGRAVKDCGQRTSPMSASSSTAWPH